MLITEYIWLL